MNDEAFKLLGKSSVEPIIEINDKEFDEKTEMFQYKKPKLQKKTGQLDLNDLFTPEQLHQHKKVSQRAYVQNKNITTTKDGTGVINA